MNNIIVFTVYMTIAFSFPDPTDFFQAGGSGKTEPVIK